MKFRIGIALLIFLLIFLFVPINIFADPSPADTPTPTPASDNSRQIQDLQNQINDLQGKISSLQSQEKTLSSQITLFDSQIKQTQLRIDATKDQLDTLNTDIDTTSKRIARLEDNINELSKVLLNRIVATYEIGSAQPLQILLHSNSANDFVTRANYLRLAQAHDKKLIFETQQAKDDYANQKQIFEDKKKKVEALKTQLEAYTTQLNGEKKSKQQLLVDTQGNEVNYQRLLAQAQAQLSGFNRFVISQGGASILSGQTSCDGWGCYYNQRDSQWGNTLINNQSGYSMAGYGCLITSVSMVLSHMGHKDVLPSDIAQSDSGNFAVNTAMLKYTINVKGLNIVRNGASLDNALKNGPVIVGIYAYGGTHFVVLTGGSNGSYTMNDPFIPGGKNISFGDHYSTSSIFEADTVSIQ